MLACILVSYCCNHHIILYILWLFHTSSKVTNFCPLTLLPLGIGANGIAFDKDDGKA
jgi:hypothetical protein